MKRDSHTNKRLAEVPSLCKNKRAEIQQWAGALSFADCGFAGLDHPLLVEREQQLAVYLQKKYHATMGWMERAERAHANALMPEAKTAIVLATNYNPDDDPLKRLTQKNTGVISVYALGEDYHRVIAKKTKALAQQIQQTYACSVKTFVDTAPLMEKPLGAVAGIGWQGKHSNLLSKKLGSWFFLSVILTNAITAESANSAALEENCGTCSACLDICPTQAFAAPYQLDSAKCISYLTIEHKGHIDKKFRKAMGNRIYGCDDCLAVCPWNKFAQDGQKMMAMAPCDELKSPALAALLALTEASFAALFHHSPIKRTGYARFLRNVLIAAGNSENAALIPAVEKFLWHEEALLRLAAVWALRELATPEAFNVWKAKHARPEKDEAVKAEWQGESL